MYLAMTVASRNRNNNDCWNIHGIEISNLLHEQAIDYLKKAVEQNLFSFSSSDSDESTSLSLHLGAAEEFSNIFGQVDIVFAYSTAFSAKSFSPEIGTLLLDPEWSGLLSEFR